MEACQILEPCVLTLRIQPHEGISLRFVAKVPGDQLSVCNVLMNMTYDDAFHTTISDAYERLLLDCMRGDATLFMRRDGVEEAWRFVTPILEAWDADGRSPVPQYEPGTMGPPEADELIARDGRRWN
jgi:glucose-6-phosphate 1-dehydrogenase